MKKLNMLLLSLTISLHCIAQEKPISSIANVLLPSNAIKLDKKTMLERSKQVSSNSDLQIIKNDKNLYRIDKLSLGLWDVSISNEDKRNLEIIRAQALELFKLDNTIVVENAVIKTFNNNQFLLITYHKGNANYLRFLTEYKNHKSLNGILEYSKNDTKQAKDVINELLKNITFK